MSSKPKPQQGPKIVTLDIETAPIEALVWSIWEQNVSIPAIKTDWSILSFAAKWFDKKEIIYKDTGGRGAGKVRDDKELLKSLWNLLDEADVVCGHNVRSFDVKKIQTRFILNGMPPPSPFKTIDTKLIAKKHFAFTSNKLEFLSDKLTKTKKLKHERFIGLDLWKEVLKDNPKAWAEMKKYNIADTQSTDELLKILLQWGVGLPNVSIFNDKETQQCPRCGSENLQKRGWSYTQLGKFQRYQCLGCSSWLRGRSNASTPEKRKSLLVGI